MNVENKFIDLKRQLIDLIDDPNNFKSILSILQLQKMLTDKIYKRLESELEPAPGQTDNWIPDYKIEYLNSLKTEETIPDFNEEYNNLVEHVKNTRGLIIDTPYDEDLGEEIYMIKIDGQKRVMLKSTMMVSYVDLNIIMDSYVIVGYIKELDPDLTNKKIEDLWVALIFGCQIKVEEWNLILGKFQSEPIDDIPFEEPLTEENRVIVEEFLPTKVIVDEPEALIIEVKEQEVGPLDPPLEKLVPEEIVLEAIPIEVPVPEEKPKLQLTPHQQERFDGVTTKIDEIIAYSNNIVRPPNAAYYLTALEGAAGTGKTTMMVKVLEHLLYTKAYKVIFCSPTHQALGVIRETLRSNEIEFTEDNDVYINNLNNLIIKTLASFLGIKISRDLENGTESFVPDPKAPILQVDVLAIDESSMISKEQLRIILQKLHVSVKCVLFIGDEVQLDSPSDNNESNGIFSLPLKYSLQEVVRQASDNKILQFAWEIREYILSKNCPYLPSQLLHPERRNNENILVLRNQQEFLTHYFNNPSESKLISTFTNKITNEYNAYIRQMKLIGQGGKPLDIDIDYEPSKPIALTFADLIGPGLAGKTSKEIAEANSQKPKRNIITNWNEFREFYVGEELVLLEPNTRNSDIIHQTGERIRIRDLAEDTKDISITIHPTEMFGEPEVKTFSIRHWIISDENYKTLRVVKQEDLELYNEVLQLLMTEAKKNTGKYRWSKYYDFKERFVKVNKVFAFTLHKLQGSTCEDIYVDARDLDKFWGRMPIAVYKLIYIAATRPKQHVIFLI